MLPLGFKDTKLGKWLPIWERSFIISQKILEVVYCLMDIQGNEHSRSINARYLKKYYLLPYIKKNKAKEIVVMTTSQPP